MYCPTNLFNYFEGICVCIGDIDEECSYDCDSSDTNDGALTVSTFTLEQYDEGFVLLLPDFAPQRGIYMWASDVVSCAKKAANRAICSEMISFDRRIGCKCIKKGSDADFEYKRGSNIYGILPKAGLSNTASFQHDSTPSISFGIIIALIIGTFFGFCIFMRKHSLRSSEQILLE